MNKSNSQRWFEMRWSKLSRQDKRGEEINSL